MNQLAEHGAAESRETARGIVPRAEFRVFGLGILDIVKPRLWNGRTILGTVRAMPPEIYILSRHTDRANVKLRDRLLDIKVMTGTTADGYEIFQPSGKYEFPVGNQDLATVAAELGTRFDAAGGVHTLEELTTLVKRDPDLAIVRVEKVRYGFTIDRAICEYAEVRFNGALVESACVESDQYDRMAIAIRELGLTGYPNTNYIRAAKRVLGWE